MSVIWRPLTAADAPAWSRLVDEVAVADGAGEPYSPEALAEEIDAETVAGVEGEELVAVGQVYPPVRQHDGEIRAVFDGAVRPQYRGQGIGTELLSRLQQRAVTLSGEQFPGTAVRPRTHAEGSARRSRALLEAHGYRPARWFTVMSVGPRPGFRSPRLQRFRPELDDAVRSAHVAAFTTHWGSSPVSDHTWRVFVTGSRTFRPEFSSVAATIDGTVDGYALAYQYEPGEIWIGQLGVLPALRRRGLATSLLQATLAEAASHGIERVKLSVDSANQDGAPRLYEAAGFTSERSYAVYQLS
jgi:ribosomal protein S18 acetylase RimI-like enzyme